jgi:hypothetical protein
MQSGNFFSQKYLSLNLEVTEKLGLKPRPLRATLYDV